MHCKEILMSFFPKSEEMKVDEKLYGVTILGDDSRDLICAVGQTPEEAWEDAHTKIHWIWSALLTPKAATYLAKKFPSVK